MEEDDYKRITLRIPKDLHEKLASAAKASSKSMNAEIVSRAEESFSQGSTAATLGVLARHELMLADCEQENVILRVRLNEFAMALKMAMLCIPQEKIKSDAELRRHMEEWESDITEVAEDITELLNEAKMKTDKFLAAADRLDKLAGKYAAEKAAESDGGKPEVKRVVVKRYTRRRAPK